MDNESSGATLLSHTTIDMQDTERFQKSIQVDSHSILVNQICSKFRNSMRALLVRAAQNIISPSPCRSSTLFCTPLKASSGCRLCRHRRTWFYWYVMLEVAAERGFNFCCCSWSATLRRIRFEFAPSISTSGWHGSVLWWIRSDYSPLSSLCCSRLGRTGSCFFCCHYLEWKCFLK